MSRLAHFLILSPGRGACICYTHSIEVILAGLDSGCRTTAEVSTSQRSIEEIRERYIPITFLNG